MVCFRAFAAQRGTAMPVGAEADAPVRGLLVRTVAGVGWGSAGPYSVEARLDPAVPDATQRFGEFPGRP
ncbi:MAG: hypothetical protein K8S21_11865 [Gemmatimonadetes bacterium]|nr:hypothetical protein [Gemmatimonadota bacterium]